MSSRDTQNRIKKTAIRLFNQFGTGRVSTNTVAQECKISKGNLHYHFKNKQEIIQAIFADMVTEIESGWYGDEQNPTIIHMAEMFARQLDLIWRYRFFYREMVSLSRADPVLNKAIAEYRTKRIEALIYFFETLVEAGALKKVRSKESLRYLVLMTWIFSDNWLNFMELQGNYEMGEVAQLGYDFIIEILYPYLTEQAKKEIYNSYDAIKIASSN